MVIIGEDRWTRTVKEEDPQSEWRHTSAAVHHHVTLLDLYCYACAGGFIHRLAKELITTGDEMANEEVTNAKCSSLSSYGRSRCHLSGRSCPMLLYYSQFEFSAKQKIPFWNTFTIVHEELQSSDVTYKLRE